MAATPLLMCQRIGCSARYNEASNPEGGCRYHSGAPVFHDGMKEWPCCRKRSHDFQLFMDIPGCRVGRHTQEKPDAPASAAPAPVAAPVKLVVSSSQSTDAASCPRCRQGFYCSEHEAGGVQTQAPAAPPPPPPVAESVDPDVEQTCRNAGCGRRFKERDNSDQAVRRHNLSFLFFSPVLTPLCLSAIIILGRPSSTSVRKGGNAATRQVQTSMTF